VSATVGQPRTLPLVAVLYDVPLFAESLDGVFDGFADVQAFPSGPHAGGLLRWIRPDALIVEGADAGFAFEFARAEGVPLVHVRLRGNPRLTVLAGGASQAEDIDVSPSAIRNAILGSLVAGRLA